MSDLKTQHVVVEGDATQPGRSRYVVNERSCGASLFLLTLSVPFVGAGRAFGDPLDVETNTGSLRWLERA